MRKATQKVLNKEVSPVLFLGYALLRLKAAGCGACGVHIHIGIHTYIIYRDPYIIHLNIALYMVVSLILVDKTMFQTGNMYLFRSPDILYISGDNRRRWTQFNQLDTSV